MSELRRAYRLLLPAVVLALAGCASIPTSGPVSAGGDLRPQRANNGVPFIGQRPVPGASPSDVVLGFLQNGADFVNDHEVAREYLTPAARQRWRPQAGTVVYDGVAAAPASPAGDALTVKATGTEVGSIDPEGSFSRAASGSPFERSFRMQKVDGQWRIASLDDGLVLPAVDVAETYRQISLYFLSPSGTKLVPDTVLLPQLPGLTTKLVARLLHGPSASIRGGVSTAFPAGTGLEVSSVPIRGGVATVRLDNSALAADDHAREQMSAQIVWTLKQLPEVLRVRITAGGENLVVSGVAEEQDRNSWRTYDPDELVARPSAYLAREGRIGRYVGATFEPVPGFGGTGDPALRTPAASLDARRLAAVSTDGRTAYVGQLARDAPLEPRVRGGDLSQPSWDPDNNLWVVDRATGELWYLPDGADRAEKVTLPRFGDGRKVTSVSVARDGARVALIVGTGKDARVLIGAVSRVESAAAAGGETLTVVEARDVVPDLRSVRDVSWADSGTLAVVGSQDGGVVSPFYVTTDGYDIRPIEALAEPVSITAAPPLQPQENPVVIGTADGQVHQFTPGAGWETLGPGTDPSYPG